jgi:D-alanyl-D-alanine carboxypeptidase/D-alanyl-D-alanine-endopeptidase (penicillin-binding protein 4)
LEQLAAFLKQVGIEPEESSLSDGSGLSRRDRLTASALAKLLVYMDASPNRRIWADSLPVGGVDGTLEERFQQNAASKAAGKRISAKTGSLSHTGALAGYASSKTHGRLAFAILVNNFTDAGEIREIVDKIGVLLTQ